MDDIVVLSLSETDISLILKQSWHGPLKHKSTNEMLIYGILINAIGNGQTNNYITIPDISLNLKIMHHKESIIFYKLFV